MNTRKKTISAFNYFGGKARHLDFILPLLNTDHKHYFEPFCGGASVFLNKEPSAIETINDLDSRIINFFYVLRKHPARLIKLLQLTPYSRQEFLNCGKATADKIEDARRLFVLIQQGFAGNFHSRKTSWRINIEESRKGKSLEVDKFFKKVDGLQFVSNRLQMAHIENRDAFELIKMFDRPNCLMYVDPPYLPSTRTKGKDYGFELTNNDHLQLATLLNSCKGKIAISTYDNEYYDQLYPADKWVKHTNKLKRVNLGDIKKRETVYTNYPINTINKLF